MTYKNLGEIYFYLIWTKIKWFYKIKNRSMISCDK